LPATLPLEVALQVVDIAHFRRLDERAIEHMRRLTRIGLTCRAFYGVVEWTLRTTMIATLSSSPDRSFLDRTLAAVRAGTPFETLDLRVAQGQVVISISKMHGRDAVRKVTLLPKGPVGGFVHLAWLSDIALPAVESFVASGVKLQGPPCPFNHLRELALSLYAPDLVRKIISPSLSPNLRILALRDCVTSAARAHELFDDDLLARLDFGQITFHHFHTDPTNRLYSKQHATPILICRDRAAASGIIPDDFCPPYFQLNSIRGSVEQSAVTVLYVTTCIRQGAAKKALFLPQELHPSTAIPASSSLSRARDDLLDAIDDAEVEYVGWYYADEETDASISEPFRRYLDRERLEGRM
ncbi:hypothetical protein AAT19DRAFT_14380, partial [Rhodotorula toruloides]